MDQDVELTYTVTVRTLGNPEQSRERVGHRLAKLCGLNFTNFRVEDEGYRYDWSPEDHGGIGQIRRVDSGTTHV